MKKQTKKQVIIELPISDVYTDIYNYYLCGEIDYNLYKALIHIITYEVTDYNKSYRVSSHNMRIKQLFNDFKLWYKRSDNKLTLHSLYQILKVIKIKTYYIDKHDYTNYSGNKSYNDFISKVFNEGKTLKNIA